MIGNFELLGRTYSAYQIAATLGILVAGFVACRLSAKRRIDDNDMIIFLLVSSIGVFFGSHFLFGLTRLSQWPLLWRADSVRAFFSAVFQIFGGAVFYGGLLGGMLAGYLYARKKRFEFADFADICAPTAALFHFFGRIGCFLSGCCYGVAWEHGVTYHHSILSQANGVARFPVQLVEAGFELLMFFALLYCLQRGLIKRRLFCVYLICYAAVRFALEFLRGDEYRGIFLRLSTSQWISMPVLIGAALCLWRITRAQKARRLSAT